MLPLIYRREKGKGVGVSIFYSPEPQEKKYQFGILRGGEGGGGYRKCGPEQDWNIFRAIRATIFDPRGRDAGSLP